MKGKPYIIKFPNQLIPKSFEHGLSDRECVVNIKGVFVVSYEQIVICTRRQ